MIDDRVSCHDCANFDGSCSASSKAVPGAWIFMPTLIDIPRRCIFFAPQRNNQDPVKLAPAQGSLDLAA